jgi:hypothetical protein
LSDRRGPRHSHEQDFYPLSWSTLNYDTNLGGYRVTLTKDQLDQVPKYKESQGWNWNRDSGRGVYDYYTGIES